MKIIGVLLFAFIVFHTTLSVCLASAAEPKRELPLLEAEVAELREKKLLHRTENIEKVLKLAGLYRTSGKSEEALNLYNLVLQNDSWNLSARLERAGVLEGLGRSAEAREDYKLVAEYSEDAEMHSHAIGKLPPALVPNEDSSGLQHASSIFVVPVGDVDALLLKTIRHRLEELLGIDFVAVEMGLPLGDFDRTFKKNYVEDIFSRFADMPEEQSLDVWKAVCPALDCKDTFGGKAQFIRVALLRYGGEAGRQQVKYYEDMLKYLDENGQYEADGLVQKLGAGYPLDEDDLAVGVLGITAEDLFVGDYNFVYGSAAQKYGVVSYKRFMAAFNNEQPNRGRLTDRFLKQSTSSVFFILGIPRCSTPACARAFPRNLNEHDAKPTTLCPLCKQRLKEWKAGKRDWN